MTYGRKIPPIPLALLMRCQLTMMVHSSRPAAKKPVPSEACDSWAKKACRFNYTGETRGLRERGNQKHRAVHMDEFFDHYLKGAPGPDCKGQGVSFPERRQRDVRPHFGEPTTRDRPRP